MDEKISDLKAAKSAMRAAIREQLKIWDTKALAAEDNIICSHVLKSSYWKQAQKIFCYVPCGRELDVMPLIKRAIFQGRELYVPLITGAGAMEARRLESLELLRPGSFGIGEPPPDSESISVKLLDLVILPGLAFDLRSFARLGKGGGYYDRFLMESTALRLAPVRLCQLKSNIPCEKHDIKADLLVTAGGFLPHPAA